MRRIIRRILLPVAAAYLALASGVARAEELKKPSLDAWIENFSMVDTAGTNSHTQRIHVNKDLFRADHTIASDGYESERLGLRHKISLDKIFSGRLGGFGSTDNLDNYSIGAEFDGTLADLIQAGFALEKSHTGSGNTRLFQIYAGADPVKNATIRLGYFRKDGISHFQGVGWTTLDNFFVGAGGHVSEKGKGKANLCLASHASEKGKGVGFKIWGQTDFDGNYSIDAQFRIGDNLGSIAHKGLMDLFDNGINDPGVADNIANFRVDPLYMHAKNALFRIRASHSKDGTVTYSGAAYVRTADLLGKDVNLTLGGTYTRLDLPGQAAQDMFGLLLAAKLGPFFLEYGAEFGRGMKPNHFVYAGASAKDIYEALAED
jgi:hypothetical protein